MPRRSEKVAGVSGRVTLTSLLLLCATACHQAPEWYPMPAQDPALEQSHIPLRRFVSAADVNAEVHFVKDVSLGLDANAWRWAHEHPAFRFPLPDSGAWSFLLEYTVPASVLEVSGPGTLTIRVNGQLLARVPVKQAGRFTFKQRVPGAWLRPGGLNTVEAYQDRYRQVAGGPRLTYIFHQGGFVE
jgi:hypothetical protein